MTGFHPLRRFVLPNSGHALGISFEAFHGDIKDAATLWDHAHGGELMRQDKLVGILFQFMLQRHMPVVAGHIEVQADLFLLFQADEVDNVVHRGRDVEKFLSNSKIKFKRAINQSMHQQIKRG